MTLRLKLRRHELARRAYKLVCLKSDVEDARSIEAEYKKILLGTYANWVHALARSLQKTQESDMRKALVIGSIEKLHGTLKTLGRKYLTKSFEVATGRKRLRQKQMEEMEWGGWEPDEAMLDEMMEAAIAENDEYLAMSLSPALLETAKSLFEEPDEFTSMISIVEEMKARAYQVGQYASAVWALFWEGFAESRPPEMHYAWKGTDDDVLCSGCRPRLWQVYRKDRLPGWPADGSTPCQMNCRCWLEEFIFVVGYVVAGGRLGRGTNPDLSMEYCESVMPEKDLAYVKELYFQPNLQHTHGFTGIYTPPERFWPEGSRQPFGHVPGYLRLDQSMTTNYVLVHEMGHISFFERLTDEQRSWWGSQYEKWTGEGGLYHGMTTGKIDPIAMMSGHATGYAFHDVYELHAETYSFFMRGDLDKISEMPEIIEWFEKEYGADDPARRPYAEYYEERWGQPYRPFGGGTLPGMP